MRAAGVVWAICTCSLSASPCLPGVFWRRRSRFPPTETERDLCRHHGGADGEPSAGDAPIWDERRRRAGELMDLDLSRYGSRGHEGCAASQMEALQRIHVFRLFDAYSLRDCLSALRRGGLLQVGSPFLLLIYQLRKTDHNFNKLFFLSLPYLALGVWRRLRQGRDRGLCVSCYLSSAGRQTKWRWFLFLLLLQSQSGLKPRSHLAAPGLQITFKKTKAPALFFFFWKHQQKQADTLKSQKKMEGKQK